MMPPDYSGENLRGRSFEGKNLEGANFSKADIRGANFTNAILKGADFTGAKAGLQKRWVIGLLIAILVMSAFSGFISIFIGVLVAYIFDINSTENALTGITNLVAVIIFLLLLFVRG